MTTEQKNQSILAGQKSTKKHYRATYGGHDDAMFNSPSRPYGPPIYIEGPAVVTNIISTGAAFAITDHGDVYIPAKIATAYKLYRGQCIEITARKNFKAYGETAPYLIIDILDVNGSRSDVVTSHTEEVIEDDPEYYHFAVMKDNDCREVLEAVCDEARLNGNGLINAEMYFEYINDPHADVKEINNYLLDLVARKLLWFVSISQGEDQDEVFHAEWFTMHPNLISPRNM